MVLISVEKRERDLVRRFSASVPAHVQSNSTKKKPQQEKKQKGRQEDRVGVALNVDFAVDSASKASALAGGLV